MLYIGRHETGVAIIYDTLEQATQEQGSSYLEVESLPPGDGILMTDLKTLWWEEVPPQPEPEPEEDPYAEMAKAIREGVNEV